MAVTRKPLILVADDQDNMRNMIQRVLKLEGFDCVMAANGQLALDALDEKHIDVALLDINMPLVDGLAVVEHMRSTERLKHIPIIMITGSMDVSHVLRCKALGVRDYLVKPYKIAELLKRLHASLGKPSGQTPEWSS